MYLINGKPFLDVDSHLVNQLHELESMKKQMSIAIARTMAKKSGIDDYVNFKEFIYPKKFEDMNAYENIMNFDPVIDEDVLELSKRERELYFKMQYGLYSPITYLSIQDVSDWSPLGDNDDHIHFEFLKKWVQTLPFEKVKVIRLMIQEPGQKTLLHTDLYKSHVQKCKDNNETPVIRDTIFFSPFETKRFYMYDEETNEKHYVNCKASIWNGGNWHGADATEFPTWTIKVHGTFTAEFRKSICL